MTKLQADASTTSAIWMTPSEIDGILAATWGTPPTPPVRTLTSDSEVPGSGWALERGFADLLTELAAIFVAGVGRRARADLAAEATPQPESRPVAEATLTILDPVRAQLNNLSATVAARAKVVVDRLTTELARIDVEGLPPIYASVGDDGAFLVEWTLGRRRLGLNVEAKPDDSSWYYISFDPGHVASATGPLSDLDLPLLLRRLIQE